MPPPNLSRHASPPRPSSRPVGARPRGLWTVAAVAAVAAAAATPGEVLAKSDPALRGELLVKLKDGKSLPGVLTRYRLSLVDRFGQRPIYRLKIVGNATVSETIAKLTLDPAVQIAEPNYRHASPEERKNHFWAIGTPQAYAAQWAIDAMNLPKAWKLAQGEGVRIAVLDTGVDTRHPALRHRLIAGRDFVDDDDDPSERAGRTAGEYGHGTHVAGLIAKAAPQAQLMPLRVLNSKGRGNGWVLAEALLYAVDPDGDPSTADGAQIINLSLGSLGRTRLLKSIAGLASCEALDDPATKDEYDDDGYLEDKVRCTKGPGAVVVIAAGNDASRKVKEWPGAESAYGKIAVGATQRGGKLASFSNRGSWVDVAAPGDAVTSTMAGGGYATWSGTSMAAPLVAATAALLRERYPKASAEDLVRRITRTARPICDESPRRVDAYAALRNDRPKDSDYCN